MFKAEKLFDEGVLKLKLMCSVIKKSQ